MKQFQNQTFRMVTFVLTIVSIAACYWQCVMVPQQDAANMADEMADKEAKHQAYLDSLRIDALKHKHIIVHDENPKTDTLRIALDGRDVTDRYAWNPIEGEEISHSSDSISYRWAKISGDGGTLIDKNQKVASFLAKVKYKEGYREFVFTLTAMDKYKDSATDTITLLVFSEPNQAPVWDTVYTRGGQSYKSTYKYEQEMEEKRKEKKKKRRSRD